MENVLLFSLLCSSILFIWYRALCISGFVAKSVFKFLILLLIAPESKNCKHVPPCLMYAEDETQGFVCARQTLYQPNYISRSENTFLKESAGSSTFTGNISKLWTCFMGWVSLKACCLLVLSRQIIKKKNDLFPGYNFNSQRAHSINFLGRLL